MNKVSVIVPVYNIEAYIEKCVNSLMTQSYANIEIILVDDGSTDNSVGLCDSFAKTDERIKVIHKINGGLSSARNVGISQAVGDFIVFVDGDDFVTEDYVETLLNACLKNECKIAACGYFEYYSEDSFKVICGENDSVKTSEEAITDIFTMKNEISVVAWNKMYSADLIKNNNILFPEQKIHEDVFTTYRLCATTDKIAYVKKPCYYYVQRIGSIMNQKFSKKRLQLLEAVESIEPFVKNNSPIYDEAYEYYVFLNYLTVLNNMADSSYKDKQLFIFLSQKIKNMYEVLCNNSYFNKKNKFTCFLLNFGMTVFYVTRRIYKHF